ncbi:MAG: phosphate ABC transporter permease PstA [Planctomycetota bacterium]|nr:phosphate ABC transporter permease PstA [Planctomycetota bacterium]
MNNSKTPSLWSSGEPFIWLTGGALALSLIMVAGIMLLIIYSGMGFFWPRTLHTYTLKNGKVYLAQLIEREARPKSDDKEPDTFRIKIKQANRSLQNPTDFLWIDEADIAKDELNGEAVVLERRAWGDFYGYFQEIREEGKPLAKGSAETQAVLERELPKITATFDEIYRIERYEVGGNSEEQFKINTRLRVLARDGITSGPEVDRLNDKLKKLQEEYKAQEAELASLRSSMKTEVVMRDAQGRETLMPLSNIVHYYGPNAMGFFQKIGHYFSKVGEFIFDNPRESNTEGGVWPALFGTVLMVIMMSVVVTPLGVIAAFYLREYAKQGTFVSIVRIAVNNLAGVPSIVFGVFGVGFFIYFIGGQIDSFFFSDTLPTPTFKTGGILWASLTLSLLTVPVVIVATEEGLAAIPNGMREASLALGATKFETTWRVVLPALMPSILTGLVLAVARAAGEVAPLMITGVVKLAPTLALDGSWPFLHLDRKFMHLGFHIYDVGFQSPNVDAARPMVFTTSLLLIIIVVCLNIFAISIRNRLKKKFATSAV